MRLALAFAAGAAIAAAASAFALPANQSVALQPGDSAYFEAPGELTTCQVLNKRGVETFSCFVGGEYRAKYGVAINGREVTVNQYFGVTAAKRYKTVVRLVQGNFHIAHP